MKHKIFIVKKEKIALNNAERAFGDILVWHWYRWTLINLTSNDPQPQPRFSTVATPIHQCHLWLIYSAVPFWVPHNDEFNSVNAYSDELSFHVWLGQYWFIFFRVFRFFKIWIIPQIPIKFVIRLFLKINELKNK